MNELKAAIVSSVHPLSIIPFCITNENTNEKMTMIMRPATICILVLSTLCIAAQVEAVSLAGRFRESNTADPDSNQGGRSARGNPIHLTWSIVPDGTSLGLNTDNSQDQPSDLISVYDNRFGDGNPNGPGGSNLTQRPWFDIFSTPFSRWDAVSGVDFSYEPNDDGSDVDNVIYTNPDYGKDVNPGKVGTRGDIRIGGRSLGKFNAITFLPDISDVYIDTSDNIGKNASQADVSHEVGHTLGFGHPIPSGPQQDGVQGAHRYYGDSLEENGGNDSTANATQAGSFSPGQSFSIGTDANNSSNRIGDNDTDFVSIDDESDTDMYEFNVSDISTLNAILTPKGHGDTDASSDLALQILDTTGTITLGESDSGGLGDAENINLDPLVPGDYFAQVTGADNDIQLYELDLDFSQVPEPNTMLLLLGAGAPLVIRRRNRSNGGSEKPEG